MKKLLFDGTSIQGFDGINYHGGGEYALFMLREMVKRGCKFDIVFNKNKFTDPEAEELIKENFAGKVHEIDNTAEMYELIDRDGYDTFYSPLPYNYTAYPCKAQMVGVIHGLRKMEIPWDYYRYKYYSNPLMRLAAWTISHSRILRLKLRKRQIKKFEKILSLDNARYITVSNHTKYAIINFFPWVKVENIAVYYSPFKIYDKPATPHGDYFLMVSGNRFEKNVYRAVVAFDKLFTEGRLEGKRVVITGCGNEPFWKKIRNKERFEILPYVDADYLEKLYSNAFCFVYPSLNEGFGYPPLRAMSYGVPVVASASTSIPEACDDAACYFAPLNIDDLRNRLLQIDNDADLRTRLIDRGYRRVTELQELQKRQLDNEIEYIFS